MRAEIRTGEVFEDLLHGSEVEHFVLNDWSADGATELLAMEVFERFVVGGVCRESFETLEMKEAAVQLVGSRFGYDVHYAASATAKLRGGACGYDLEFLHRVEGDIDGCALSTDLLAEEAVVIVAAIEADVIENPALSGEVDFVAIRTLHDTYSRREGQKILEFSAQNWRGAYRAIRERSARFRLRGIDRRSTHDFHSFALRRNLHSRS